MLRVPAKTRIKFHRQPDRPPMGRSAGASTRRKSRSVLDIISHRLIKSQEDERRRIACELHDEIGQQLTCLKSLLVRRCGADGLRPQALEIVDELIGQVRNLSLRLRPSVLDDFGLLPALHKLFERYTAQNGIRVDYACDGIVGKRFGDDVETAVYRIVQEALTNVARYAGVACVVVRLWLTQDEYLKMQVEDEGRGFDIHLVTGATNGLSIMRERATLLDGTFDIHSEFNRGTSLQVSIPIKRSKGIRSFYDTRELAEPTPIGQSVSVTVDVLESE